MDELTEKQRELLTQFGQSVYDLKSTWKDNENLLRWLKSRHWDVAKAEDMIRKHVLWREKNKIDTILEDLEIPEVVSKYFPGGVCGEDKEGHPIYIEPIGRTDLKGLCYSVKKEDLLKCRVYNVEYMVRRVLKQQSEKYGRRIMHCLHIIDFEHFGKQHLWLPGGELYAAIVGTLEANYPDTLYKSYVVNAPPAFKLAFRFIKPFMSEDTLGKVVFLGADYKERLLEVIDADQLPVHYGGTRTDPDGDEFCRSEICYGGMIPVSCYRKKEELIPEGKSFEHLYLRRRAVFFLEFQVTNTNCALRWVFTTVKRDIGYGIYYKQRPDKLPVDMMEVVKETTRVNCHMVPEDGLIHCDRIGTYVLMFDNSFSVFRGKTVSYFVELVQGQDQKPVSTSALKPTKQEEEIIDDEPPVDQQDS